MGRGVIADSQVTPLEDRLFALGAGVWMTEKGLDTDPSWEGDLAVASALLFKPCILVSTMQESLPLSGLHCIITYQTKDSSNQSSPPQIHIIWGPMNPPMLLFSTQTNRTKLQESGI